MTETNKPSAATFARSARHRVLNVESNRTGGTVYSKIIATTFMRDAEHKQPNVRGDLIKIDLACGHIAWGNAHMHHKIGSEVLCRNCEKLAMRSNKPSAATFARSDKEETK
jgi:hypothetical protein